MGECDPGPVPADLDQCKPGWYLALAGPNTKGLPFGWIEVTRVYAFNEGKSSMYYLPSNAWLFIYILEHG